MIQDAGNPQLTIIVMAKQAIVGQVKTRLIGALTPVNAALLHLAMLDCVLCLAHRYVVDQRIRSLLLAVAQDSEGHAGKKLGPITPGPAWTLLDQVGSDLGQRMANAWRYAGGGPVVFLGGDTPDLPGWLLAKILPALDVADVAIGSTGDGGYWTLGANQFQPELFRGIDWGTDRVYQQTCEAAYGAGVSLVELPSWHDVDVPTDVVALQKRVRTNNWAVEYENNDTICEAYLRLTDHLERICGDLES